MYKARAVDSLDYPELAPYRTMRHQHEQRQQGIFVAEGEKVVRRLLESRLTVLSLLLPEHWLTVYKPLLEKRIENVQAFTAPKSVLETLTGFSMYQGVLAVGKVPDPISFDNLLENASKPRLFAAIEGISNAENVGVIVRNCAAFGVNGLFIGETSGSPFLRRAVRSSMGAVFNLPTLEVPSLSNTLRELQRQGILTVAAHPHAEEHRLSQANLNRDCCLVFGSEGYGLTESLLSQCQSALSVPMQSGTDSLNVASATAVFLYEANRQRGKV